MRLWRHWAAMGLAAGVAVLCHAQPAVPFEDRSPEHQADALRRALLSEALKRPLRVVSTAWLDEQGRLRESAQFTSDLRVRGVRVQSYLREGDGSRLELDVGLGMPTQPTSCPRSGEFMWRRPALTVAHIGEDFAVGERSLAAAMAGELGAVLRERSVQQGWLYRDAQWRPSSQYQAFLLGPAAPVEPWTVELLLSPLPQVSAQPDPSVSVRSALQGWGAVPRQSGWAVRLELRWLDRHQPSGSHSWREDVVVQSNGPVLDAQQALGLIRAQLNAALGRAMDWLELTLACEPLVVALAQDEAGMGLPLGADSGVKPGDRVIVMDRSQLPQRVLEPQALNSLGIAEVQAVQARSARLRWLGSPPPVAVRDAVAIPVPVRSPL